MKHQLQLLVLIGAFGGSFQAEAQPLRPPEPIVVQVAEIDREFIHAWTPPPRPEASPFLSFSTEQRAFVSFQFLHKGEREVGALVEDGLRGKRPVHIMGGNRLISTCQLAAANSARNGGVTKHGFILLFESGVQAAHAADAMGEDLTARLKKEFSSRRSWGT